MKKLFIAIGLGIFDGIIVLFLKGDISLAVATGLIVATIIIWSSHLD